MGRGKEQSLDYVKPGGKSRNSRLVTFAGVAGVVLAAIGGGVACTSDSQPQGYQVPQGFSNNTHDYPYKIVIGTSRNQAGLYTMEEPKLSFDDSGKLKVSAQNVFCPDLEQDRGETKELNCDNFAQGPKELTSDRIVTVSNKTGGIKQDVPQGFSRYTDEYPYRISLSYRDSRQDPKKIGTARAYTMERPDAVSNQGETIMTANNMYCPDWSGTEETKFSCNNFSSGQIKIGIPKEDISIDQNPGYLKRHNLPVPNQ